MQFFTAARIATLSTEILLDQLCDFAAQGAKFRSPELRAKNAQIVALLKAELASRA